MSRLTSSMRSLWFWLKVATVGYTAPVTWMVFSQKAADLPSPWREITPFCAVVALEISMLTGWNRLDHDKEAGTALRWGYTALMLLAYAAIVAAGIEHNEGIAGWLVRSVILSGMGLSIYTSGVVASIRDTAKVDRSVANSKKVRAHRRKVEERLEIEEIDRRLKETRVLREAESSVGIAFTFAEQQAGLHHAEQHKEALMNMSVAHVADESFETSATPAMWPKWRTSLMELNEERKSARQKIAAKVAEALEANPDASQTQIAKQLGISRSSVSRHLAELRETSPANSNGKG